MLTWYSHLDVYKNIKKYNLGKKGEVLIVFDEMIADIISNKKLNPLVTELFIEGRKLNISIVFITQSYFKVSKEVRLNSTFFLLWKFQTKENFNKLQWIMHQILKNLLQKNSLFQLMIRFYHQIILYELEKTFWDKF